MPKTKRKKPGTLIDCIREVMRSKTFKKRFPKGINASEMITELKRRRYNFPLIDELDIANEMRRLYGT